MTLSETCTKVVRLSKVYGYALALRKVLEDSPYTIEEIQAELRHRRLAKGKALKFKKRYQSTLPKWVKDKQETE